jgi:hypothetical protein
LFESGRYKTAGEMKRIAHLKLMSDVVMRIVSPLSMDEVRGADYLVSPGSTPFFSGLQYVSGIGVCNDLKQLFEPGENATKEEKDQKQIVRTCYNVFSSKHDALDKNISKLYEDPKKATFFIKKTLEACGFTVKGLKTKHKAKDENGNFPRLNVNGVLSLTINFAIMLNLRKGNEYVLQLLRNILFNDNLSEADKEWVREALDVYNNHAVNTGTRTVTVARTSGTLIHHSAVTSRRLLEHAVEQSHVEDTTTREDADAVAASRHHIAGLFEVAANRQQAEDDWNDQRRMIVNAARDTPSSDDENENENIDENVDEYEDEDLDQDEDEEEYEYSPFIDGAAIVV